VSIDRCNTFCFTTILMMILKRNYDYPIINDNKYNHEKSVRKCIPSILTTYSAYIEKAIWNELFVCLDLCQERYWSTLTYSSCCWCAKRASEHFLTISPFLSLSLSRRASARAHIYTYRHGVMRTSECEHLFHFIWKRERRWNKESIHLLFLLLFFFLP